MTVSFNSIPSNLAVPLFWAEMDNSQANTLTATAKPSLIVGHKLNSTPAAVGQLRRILSLDAAIAYYGRGSMLARMAAAYFASDPFGELWAIAVGEPTGVAATGTLTITGPATASGTLTLYIGGQRVQVAVLSGDTATVIAAAVASAVNAATDLPVTATSSAGVVTLTARHVGLLGNDIRIIANYRGVQGGEATPTGLSLAIAQMSGGSGVPTFTATVAAMADNEFDFIAWPFADTASLDTIGTEMGETSGRWSWSRQIYGVVYGARRDSLGSHVTFGLARNDPRVSCWAAETNHPTPPWEIAASYAARNAAYIRIHAARPTQTGALDAVLPPLPSDRWTLTEQQSLLTSGLACGYVTNGVQRITRAVTTYRTNALGQPDNSYQDSETLHTAAYVLRTLRLRITGKYARHLLASDGTRVAPGVPVVTPAVLRAELIAAYDELEAAGYVENADLFAKYLVVERNATNPNRVDVLFPPDYINQLRIFAVLNQFRLQYPANA
ncbi:phage tail sheath subtilisin-like domain-containing protein [Derxia gummosa]|uniref:Phage tail sheath subtilisin-like domain-containing protein n=1 Tax=Derxia gummosa DSM 723 TaxID=1121388 RepID=A0A8B6X3N1_9BURK|nr:phage tail sheath subtilisin-like domain-containing protein [Derxia gummosa]